MSDTANADTLDAGPCPVCGRPNAADARFCSGCGFQIVEAEEGSGDQAAGRDVADPLVGRVIADRYKITGLLGRGGTGVVYKAEHVHIGKLMAIKLLHGELSRDKDTIKRFRREAEAASKLSHPNSVQLFDFGRSEGLMYLVMEYVEGRDFGQIIQKESPLGYGRVARICAQVCASVGEAHAQGIVHRDLKPENVMISEGRRQPDFVKVLDFGLAKLREEGAGHITVTRQGHIVGTPYYMSPEQIRGEEVDGRGDIYAVGAMLYKACTGQPPFSAPSPMGVLTKHLTEELVLPSQRVTDTVPEQLDRIVEKAMQKDPADRYQHVEELRHELLDYLATTGEDPGPAALGSGSGSYTGPATSAGQRAVEHVATRSDVDAYEKHLRRRGLIGYFLGAFLIAAAGAAGWYLWPYGGGEPAPDAESEPNNTPNEADTLPPGRQVEGFLGKRLSEERSDADVYRIRNPGKKRRWMRFEVTRIPNMDIVVEVVREGSSTPVLEADTRGVGQPERIPNFPLAGTTYYLQVRERWLKGKPPTENISDPYQIRWSFVERKKGDEREINDSLELANDISVGDERRGFIGWGKDVDYYCLTQDAANIVAEVEGIPAMNLRLRVIDRTTGAKTAFDDEPIGGAERSEPIEEATSGSTCFEISAAGEGARGNANERYELRVRQVEGGS